MRCCRGFASEDPRFFASTRLGRRSASPIGRSSRGLDYPHDVSFSRSEDAELLAVAQRTGAIAIYEKTRSDERYGSEPAFEISSPKSQLAYSDGVTFVPPNNGYLAACNLELGTVLFFRRISLSPVAFEETPEFELKHPSVFHPDGLAFSRVAAGGWRPQMLMVTFRERCWQHQRQRRTRCRSADLPDKPFLE